MAGTVRSKAYIAFLNALIEQRNVRMYSQADLAKRLGKPASFVGKYELGERRLDVIEVFVILKAMDADPLDFLSGTVKEIPENLK